jgi:Photosynthesis system II assembly factor YCF48
VRLAALVSMAALLGAQNVVSDPPRKLEHVCTPQDEDTFGLICSEDDPCPVFLELNAVESNGANLFVTGDLHTQNTTLFGLLLESDDGGATWTEPNQRLTFSTLEEIQFADSQHGWIAGVKLDPLPRDPFVLATTDGGKTWQRNPLFEDPLFGSIQQFWFDSPSNGELALDRSQGATRRYERYVTMTGGSSWELEGSDNKPIALAKAKPKESSSWRVRVEKDAYRVERRADDGSWAAVASFAVHAGDCR